MVSSSCNRALCRLAGFPHTGPIRTRQSSLLSKVAAEAQGDSGTWSLCHSRSRTSTAIIDFPDSGHGRPWLLGCPREACWGWARAGALPGRTGAVPFAGSRQSRPQAVRQQRFLPLQSESV